MEDQTKTPLTENRYVKEMLSIIGDSDGSAGNAAAMIYHIAATERYMEMVSSQLAAMRRELAEIRGMQARPVKVPVQRIVKSLQAKLDMAMEELGRIKASIIEGCKKALIAIKQNGKAALNGIAEFFNIKENLQMLSGAFESSIQENRKAIAKIEALSRKYHEVGRAVSNVSRAIKGAEENREAKPTGKLAIALEKPFRANLSLNTKIQNRIKKAINKLESLDEEASKAKPGKTSVMERLDSNKERAARETINRSVPGKSIKPLEATV